MSRQSDLDNFKRKVVDPGLFDEIPEEESFDLGKAYAGRDGITYVVSGLKGDKVIISDGKSEQERERSFLRSGSVIAYELIQRGLIDTHGKNRTS